MDKKEQNGRLLLLGYACGLAGASLDTGQGPLVLQRSQALKQFSEQGHKLSWEAMLEADPSSADASVREICERLGQKTAALTRAKDFFIVLGGDHSSAVGTWSGVYEGIHQQGPLGLIWIDAHMDSHVPETSPSGRYHGMPLASLLGYGEKQFSQLLVPSPKIQPEHLSLIGVRSFEEGEAALLKKLKVRVYFMEEVKERGLDAVFTEAVARATAGTAGYGLSVDIDSIDPLEAPGVDVPELGGLKAKDLKQTLQRAAQDPRLLGAEIAEFNPSRDTGRRTERIVVDLIAALAGRASL